MRRPGGTHTFRASLHVRVPLMKSGRGEEETETGNPPEKDERAVHSLRRGSAVAIALVSVEVPHLREGAFVGASTDPDAGTVPDVAHQGVERLVVRVPRHTPSDRRRAVLAAVNIGQLR